MPDPTFQFANFTLGTILTLIFYIIFGLYIIFTAILYYHWQTYATDKLVSRITILSFFATTLPLLLIMSAVVLKI